MDGLIGKSATSAIMRLPQEVLATIAAQIEEGRDRKSFAFTCSILYHVTVNIFWKNVDIRFSGCGGGGLPRGSAVDKWTSRISQTNVDNCTFNFNAAKVHNNPNASTYGIPPCESTNCRECALIRTFGEVDVLFASQNISPRLNVLTFRGGLGECSRFLDSGPDACFRAPRLDSLRPRVFIFDMHWIFFDISILGELIWTNLRSLNIPVNVPVDCEKLGNILRRLVSLRSLAIADLPDDDSFFDEYSHIGQGILARADSLQDLEISMTNFNRPTLYGTSVQSRQEYEIFIKPRQHSYHFEMLFPTSKQRLIHRNRRRFMDDRNDIHRDLESVSNDRGPLRLRRLRLKNLFIPEYASHEVFDWTHLKRLWLLKSEVDQAVWRALQGAQLQSLLDIDYSLLPGALMDFLMTQRSLQTVVFVRPSNVYEADGFDYREPNGPTQIMKLISRMPPLGPGTAYGKRNYHERCERTDPCGCQYYPSAQKLLSLLQKNKIRDLRIPPNMYDVTPDIMRTIGKVLPNLEHLMWSFDYVDPALRVAFTESFLPNTPKLRRMTLISLQRPCPCHELLVTLDALKFHTFLESLGERVPTTLRYVRYLDAGDEFRCHGIVGTFYHRQEPKDGNWWMCLGAYEEKTMYAEDRTPQIVPIAGERSAEQRI